jgi:hypothetical protein
MVVIVASPLTNHQKYHSIHSKGGNVDELVNAKKSVHDRSYDYLNMSCSRVDHHRASATSDAKEEEDVPGVTSPNAVQAGAEAELVRQTPTKIMTWPLSRRQEEDPDDQRKLGMIVPAILTETQGRNPETQHSQPSAARSAFIPAPLLGSGTFQPVLPPCGNCRKKQKGAILGDNG